MAIPHLIQRMRERYAVEANVGDINRHLRMIRQGQAIVVGYQMLHPHGERAVLRLSDQLGEVFPVVSFSNPQYIVTYLTAQMAAGQFDSRGAGAAFDPKDPWPRHAEGCSKRT